MDDLVLALGIELRVTTTAEAGRQHPLIGDWPGADTFRYRPTWRFAGLSAGVHVGANVYAFDRHEIRLGEVARAVIVAIRPDSPEWSVVSPGTEIAMHEGARVCGIGRVVWVTAGAPFDEPRCRSWLAENWSVQRTDR